MRIRTASLLPFILASASMAATPLGVHILSATVKDQAISDAEVTFQKNGMASIAAKTNAQGLASLPSGFETDDPTVLMIVKKTGYSSLVAKCPCNGMTYALSKNMQSLDGVRVVLNWGGEPGDLDSHFKFPGSHVNFGEQQGVDANLDVDDRDGYGPETITLEKKHDGEEYVYAVHDYSHADAPKSKALSTSQAKVFVYIGTTLIKTYYVPQTKAGNLWVVFGIDEGGEIRDINEFMGARDYESVGKVLNGYIEKDAYAAAPTASEQEQGSAKELNKKGEHAYHAKKLDEAIALYRQAIEKDGNNGQAYSNLGLAFQKNNQISEAIWANRKAIALAHGASAGTVKASSYYNIARIYESQGQWADAKRNFAAALTHKQNPVYEKAIAKMDQKLKGN